MLQVLVSQEDPNTRLPLVELVTDAVEVVIEDLRQIVILNLLQFLVHLFQFFLAMVVLHHNAKLTIEDLCQEFAPSLHHTFRLLRLAEPVIDKVAHGNHFRGELFPPKLRLHEHREDGRGSLLLQTFSELAPEDGSISKGEHISLIHVSARAKHKHTEVELHARRHFFEQLLRPDLVTAFCELGEDVKDELLACD